jgi:hypothetical protein
LNRIDILVIKRMALEGNAGRGNEMSERRNVSCGDFWIVEPYFVLRCSSVVWGKVLLSRLQRDRMDGSNV